MYHWYNVDGTICFNTHYCYRFVNLIIKFLNQIISVYSLYSCRETKMFRLVQILFVSFAMVNTNYLNLENSYIYQFYKLCLLNIIDCNLKALYIKGILYDYYVNDCITCNEQMKQHAAEVIAAFKKSPVDAKYVLGRYDLKGKFKTTYGKISK